MRLRRSWLPAAASLALALVGVLAGCGGSSSHHTTSGPPREAPSVPAPATTAFGATVNALYNAPVYTAGEVLGELAALRATGATLARSDVLWEKIESTAPTGGVHHYDWRFDDAIAGSLASQGLTWLPILDYAANWAKAVPSQLHSPPRSAGLFATFAGAFAARYGPGGAFWRAHPELTPKPITTFEVWNEPDGGFWYPAPDAAAFADLYLQTRSAIDAVAPGARVVVGGLTHVETFLPAMLAARPGLAVHLDGVGIHLYERNPSRVFARVRRARRVLRAEGVGAVPLYITEIGWPTHPVSRALNPYWAPARLRPSYIARTIGTLGHSDCGIGAILVYSWVTAQRTPGYLEDWYGINPPPGRGATSADVTAFTGAIRSASAATGPPARVCGG
jgi:hypothetical protein